MTTSLRLLAVACAATFLGACAGPSKAAQSESAQSTVPQKSNAGTEDQQNPEGAAGAQAQVGGGAHHGHGAHHGGGMAHGLCPMALPGTKVSASDTDDGAALTFTTSGEVEELRRRVRGAAAHHARMAEAHAGMPGAGMGTGAGAQVGAGVGAGPASAEPGATGSAGGPAAAGTGAGCCGGAGAAAHHGQALMSATARAEDVEGGARLVLTPRDPAQVDALRADVRQHAERMASGGGCPMSMGG